MNSNQDPRVQIYTNLDDVQNEIEKSAKERKDEIKDQMKEDAKALKDEMKDLKSELKDSYKEMKQELKDSDDPNAKEKIEIAKQTRKIIENNIEADYQESKESVERHAQERMESIDNMLDNEKDDERLASYATIPVAGISAAEISNATIRHDAARDTVRDVRTESDRIANATMPHNTVTTENDRILKESQEKIRRDNNDMCGCGDDIM